MASVILDWRRVVASVQVHPPMTIKRGIADVLRHEPLLAPLIRDAGGELKVSEALFEAINEVVRSKNGKLDQLHKVIEQALKALGVAQSLSEYIKALLAAMEKAQVAKEAMQQVQAGKAAAAAQAYACNQPRIWFADEPIQHIQVAAWARK